MHFLYTQQENCNEILKLGTLLFDNNHTSLGLFRIRYMYKNLNYLTMVVEESEDNLPN